VAVTQSVRNAKIGFAVGGALLLIALAVALPRLAPQPKNAAAPSAPAPAAAPTHTPDAEPAEPPGPRIFTYFQEQPASLDPARATDAYSAAIVSQVNSPLVGLTSSLEPTPAVAESWTISHDGLTYVFTLRQGVAFHNGRPVTADDFVYSLTRLFREPQRSEGLAAGYLEAILGVPEFESGRDSTIVGIRAVDPYHLEIHLSRPYSPLLAALALDQTAPVPREIVDAPGGSEAYAASPVGCGPFRFVRREGKEKIVLAANPDYFLGRPQIDSLIYLTPHGNVETLGAEALLRGEATMAQIPLDRVDEFRARPGIRVLRWQDLSLSFIGVNTTMPPLDDPRVRHAVALAMNRQAMFDYRPTGKVLAQGILPPGLPGFVPDPRTYVRDVEAARAELKDAGYGPDHPLPELTLVKATGTPETRLIDTLLVNSLAEAGVHVRLQHVNWSTLDSLITGRHAQMFGLSWVADIPDPDTFLRALFYSKSPNNYFQYANAKVDSLLDVAALTPDQDVRSRAFHVVERLVLESAPLVPLFHTATFIGLRADVRGLEMNPLGISTLAMERLTLGDPSAQPDTPRAGR
jgi:peptide/nickel transport system substrate-binding protein/oligopeptide transport system substrate-binding protein